MMRMRVISNRRGKRASCMLLAFALIFNALLPSINMKTAAFDDFSGVLATYDLRAGKDVYDGSDIRLMTFEDTGDVWEMAGYAPTLDTYNRTMRNNQSYGMQIGGMAGDWVSVRIHVPVSGRYTLKIEHAKLVNNNNARTANVYFAPDDGTTSADWRDSEYKTGQLDFAGTEYVQRYTAELGFVDVEESGDYIVTFESNTVDGRHLFPGTIILDGTAPPELSSVSVLSENAELCAGQSTGVEVEVTLSDGGVFTGTAPEFLIGSRSITTTFESLNPDIATVNSSGSIVAHAPGTASIKANVTLDETTIESVFTVFVNSRVLESVHATLNYQVFLVGLSGELTVNALLDDDTLAPADTIITATSNNDCIAVSGLTVTGVSVGTANITITASLGGVTKSTTLVVDVTERSGDFPGIEFEYDLKAGKDVYPGSDCRSMTYADTGGVWEMAGYNTVIDSMSNPTTRIRNNQSYGMQISSVSDIWVSIRINIPIDGRYLLKIQHGKINGGMGNVYFAPYTETASDWRKSEFFVGQLDFKGESELQHIEELKFIDIESPGEYVVTFERAAVSGGAMYPGVIILDGTVPPELSSVTAVAEKEELCVGETTRADIGITLSDGGLYQGCSPEFKLGVRNVSVMLESLNADIVSINENGRIVAQSPGAATIQAAVTLDDVTLLTDFTVIVNDKYLDSVVLALNRSEFFVTQTANLDIILLLNDGSEIISDDIVINISSDNTGCVTVADRELIAHAAGNTNILVTAALGGITVNNTLAVTVFPELFDIVEVTAQNRFLKTDDAGEQISVKLKTNIGNELDSAGSSISFKSLNPETVSVSDEGFVVPVALGIGVIEATATLNDITRIGTITFNVKDGKTNRTYYTDKKVEIARENIEKYAWAKAERDKAVETAKKYLGKEELLWNMVVAEGIPRSGTLGGANDPNAYKCPYCGCDIRAKYGNYSWVINPLNDPWKIKCPECKRRFPSNDFGSLYKLGLDEHGVYNREDAIDRNNELIEEGHRGYLVNILYPEKEEHKDPNTGELINPGVHGWCVDDGWGYIIGNTYSTTEKEMCAFIPLYVRLGLWDSEKSSLNPRTAIYPEALEALGNAYLYTGEIKYGRVGAILLDRLADIFPDLDVMPYFGQYTLNHGGRGEGKAVGRIGDANRVAPSLALAYDALYPAMDDPYVVSFLNKKALEKNLANDKSTPALIRQNCEDGLLREIYEGCKKAQIYGNFGMHQRALVLAAVVLDNMPETGEMIDWVFRYGTYTTGMCTGGEVMSALVNRVDRDGMSDEAALGYHNKWFNGLVSIAEVLNGYDLFESADLYKNPKFIKMFSAPFETVMCSRAHTNTGDSGATASTGIAISKENLLIGFQRLGIPELGQMLYHINGKTADGLRGDIFTKNPEDVATAVKKIVNTYGEYDFGRSTNQPGYGLAVLRGGGWDEAAVVGKNDDTQRDFWLYYGRGQSHGHADALHLGMAAYGLNLAPDLGYPEATGTQPNRMQWVRNTISHNTVVVNETQQTNLAYNASPMHFDDAGRVKIIDVDGHKAYPSATDIYRRTVVMVDVDDTVSYGVDFFRVKGGSHHLYSFHAQSDEIDEIEGLELVSQAGGTYAGATVPWGSVSYTEVTGYNWLKEIERDSSPAGAGFAVNFKINDFRNVLPVKKDIRLRMTMLNNNLSEVTVATGMPPNTASNKMVDKLKYVLAIRKGSNLDTLYTTVYEPYEGNRYVKAISEVQMAISPGSKTGPNDVARAVKVEHKNGRVDYVMYATNNTALYSVDNSFDFKGAIGVYSFSEEGEPIYAYVNDGSVIGNYQSALPSLTGKVENFTTELRADNTITVQTRDAVEPERLAGEYVYVSNDGAQNAVYPIINATSAGNNRIVLHLGNNTLIRSYIDPTNLNGGYNYNIGVGQTAKVPLGLVYDPSPVFKQVGEKLVDVGSEIRFTVSATSPNGKPLTYSAVDLPRGASFNPETLTFSWTPGSNQTGVYYAVISADNGSLPSTCRVMIKVFGATIGNKKNIKPPALEDTGDEQDEPEEKPLEQYKEKFIDLKGYDWAKDDIHELSEKGIINGTSENTYSPGENITRADFTVLLVRAFEFTSEAKESFADIPEGAYYAEQLAIAKSSGIVTGIGGGRFDPSSAISREDIMVIAARALAKAGRLPEQPDKVELEAFSDAEQTSDYAKQAVALLAEHNIIKGTNGKLNPKGYATRAEIAVMLKRMLDFK